MLGDLNNFQTAANEPLTKEKLQELFDKLSKQTLKPTQYFIGSREVTYQELIEYHKRFADSSGE